MCKPLNVTVNSHYLNVEVPFICETVIYICIRLARFCLVYCVMWRRSLFVGIRTVLLESEDHECPDCKEKDVSPDTLIPNRFLRNNVNNFKNETGYNKSTVRQPRRLPHLLTHGHPVQVIGALPPMQQIQPEPSGPMREFTDASAGSCVYWSLLFSERCVHSTTSRICDICWRNGVRIYCVYFMFMVPCIIICAFK
jgi:hypothetical protein